MRNASGSLMKLTNDNLTNKTAVVCEYWIFNRCGFTISRVCLREIWMKREKRENQMSRTLSKGEGGEVAGQRVGRTDYVDGTMPQMPGEKTKKCQNDEIVVRTSRIYLRLPFRALFYRRGRMIIDVDNASLLFKRCVQAWNFYGIDYLFNDSIATSIISNIIR